MTVIQTPAPARSSARRCGRRPRRATARSPVTNPPAKTALAFHCVPCCHPTTMLRLTPESTNKV